MSMTVSYASQRREVWHWCCRAWLRGLWKTHASVFAVVLIAASIVLFGGPPTTWTQAAIAIGLAVLPLIGFAAVPLLKFKPQFRTLTVNRYGIETAIADKSASIPWDDIAEVRKDGEYIVIQRTNLNSFIVPPRAFTNPSDKDRFYSLLVIKGKNSHSIADPRPIAAEAPYTFFLPSAEQLSEVKVADLVKLMFEYPHQTEKWSAERMWVKVSEVEGDRLCGILDNVPDEPTSPLSLGDVIEFRRHHVLAIEWENPEKAPPPADYREYWDRCLVDDCVLEGEVPVEFIYREEPDMAQAGDTYPDSGWRIRGRQGTSTDANMEARKLSYVALGAVLNQDDSWLSWIDAPIGTALMRDFDAGCYVPEE